MAATNDSTDGTTQTAVVAIRIPCGSGMDLTSEVEERLARGPGVEDVAVETICGLEPRLSATIVTARVQVALDIPVTRGSLEERFARLPGFEAIVR